MNPWLIVGALVALIAVGLGAGAYGHHLGVTAEREAWEKREAQELADANTKIRTLEEAARTSEAAHAAALAEIDAKHTQEIEDAKKQRDRDVRDARSGRIVLRIPTPCKAAGGGAAAKAPAAPGVGDGGATAELPRAVTADLLELADDADAVVRQLQACQGVVRADRAQ